MIASRHEDGVLNDEALTAFITRLLLPSGLSRASWLVGAAIAFFSGRAIHRSFRQALQKLDKPGWY